MIGLKQRREKIGISQVELARRVGYSKAWISMIENSKEQPSRRLAGKINRALEDKQVQRGETFILPKIPFKDETERKKLHEIWCERYGYLY